MKLKLHSFIVFGLVQYLFCLQSEEGKSFLAGETVSGWGMKVIKKKSYSCCEDTEFIKTKQNKKKNFVANVQSILTQIL